MGLSKFVNLLNARALFFARADKFDDRFEGSISKASLELPAGMSAQEREQLRGRTMVSCWHINEYESAAMWHIYLKSKEGVAIQTTYGRLKNSFKSTKEDVHMGLVKYVDYEKEPIPASNTFYPFLHKRTSYEYEKEVRAVLQNPACAPQCKMDENGVYVSTDIGELVNTVFVSPLAEKWFYDVVCAVVSKFGFDFKVHYSDLTKDPVY
jgi:hypothetical protein